MTVPALALGPAAWECCPALRTRPPHRRTKRIVGGCTAVSDLILQDGVDIIVVAGTPESVNPVADRCERNGVPCIPDNAPWQPYLFGRKGDPKKPFKWTYHFF